MAKMASFKVITTEKPFTQKGGRECNGEEEAEDGSLWSLERMRHTFRSSPRQTDTRLAQLHGHRPNLLARPGE